MKKGFRENPRKLFMFKCGIEKRGNVVYNEFR